MKKVITLISFLFLIIFSLIGCSSSEENEAQRVAEEFAKSNGREPTNK